MREGCTGRGWVYNGRMDKKLSEFGYDGNTWDIDPEVANEAALREMYQTPPEVVDDNE